jgi:hypothetical protein
MSGRFIISTILALMCAETWPPAIIWRKTCNVQNMLKLQAPWDEVKEKLKEIDLSLTDEDLEYAPGEELILLTRLSKKMGRSTADVRAWIESVSANDGKAS